MTSQLSMFKVEGPQGDGSLTITIASPGQVRARLILLRGAARARRDVANTEYRDAKTQRKKHFAEHDAGEAEQDVAALDAIIDAITHALK